MHNKIIGFTISQYAMSHSDVDIFNRGLNIVYIQHVGLHLYLWGLGNLEECKINSKYSLSFPLHDSLLDRNILISLNPNSISVENDWMGSIPVFYNLDKNIVSTLSLKVLKNVEIDEEGLFYYLRCGFCAFEHTPIKNVKFLRHSSQLTISKNKINIEYKKDCVIENNVLDNIIDEQEVWKKIINYVFTQENKIKGDIVIPTSGGYDSRLLNYLISDKSRIHSFSYGISARPEVCREVVLANKLSQLLQTKWQRIPIGNYVPYKDKWFNLYGFSTHLHGMYHIEFYTKILNLLKCTDNFTLLSGIIGDGWSGKVVLSSPNSAMGILNLSYSHGLNIPGEFVKIKPNLQSLNSYFNVYRNFLKNKKFCIITAMRLKIILLSYLMQLPEYMGLPAWSPFLNFDIVMAMLQLQDVRRNGRQWQVDFFQTCGINLESMNLSFMKNNVLDLEAFKKHRDFKKININFFTQYCDKRLTHSMSQPLTNLSAFYYFCVLSPIDKIIERNFTHGA